jgi:hypothetical protein|tara:strand:+ start:330 stop:614 length:285 start_codon:yes stop_codon:yes gene_type:complete
MPSNVIRKGRYKLIHFFEDKWSELYDYHQDLNETNDLSQSRIREKQLMEKELFAWWKETEAALPLILMLFQKVKKQRGLKVAKAKEIKNDRGRK